MIALPSPEGTKLYVSQIIDNLPDLALFFGSDIETIVNYAQRHFKASHRQWEWLTVRAMVRQVLGSAVRVDYDNSGKPTLTRCPAASDYKDILPHISISHSKTHAAILLSSRPCIGVDIEQISPRILRLANRIAQPAELPPAFHSLSEAEQAKTLTMIWTIKEAVYKSLDNQEHFDLLTDVRVTPSSVLSFPATAELDIKGKTGITLAYCQQYCNSVIAIV